MFAVKLVDNNEGELKCSKKTFALDPDPVVSELAEIFPLYPYAIPDNC